MEKRLGLDVGTNSIGWAFIETNPEEREGKIIAMGSRIIPMEGLEKDFNSGKSVTKNADRRILRIARRMQHRYKLRRQRLVRVFKQLGFLPESFPESFSHLSRFNINDYLPYSEDTISGAKIAFNTENPSNDKIIYYLRYKALREQISLQEFARIIYHFNQRRGFKSSRKAEPPTEDSDSQSKKYPILEKSQAFVLVESMTENGVFNRNRKQFILTGKLSDGRSVSGIIEKDFIPNWIGQSIEFVITKKTLKNGESTTTFSIPNPTEWEKSKKSLESEIEKSGLHVGEFYFQRLKQNPHYRIKDRIIDRKFYQSEFVAIWNKQIEYYNELNKSIPESVITLLYKNNREKQRELSGYPLQELILKDIIYYQRPLKSQKHLIAKCEKEYKIGSDGKKYGIRVAAVSNPYFQEYRVWQYIHNFRITRKANDQDTSIETDVTKELMTDDCKVRLFEYLRHNRIISENVFWHLILPGTMTKEFSNYSLNIPIDKLLGDETSSKILKAFKRAGLEETGKQIIQNHDNLYLLWHILYSLEDFSSVEKALLNNFKLPSGVTQILTDTVSFDKQYCSLSEKAIKKLLTLMRVGRYWNHDSIPVSAKAWIEKRKSDDDEEDEVAEMDLSKWEGQNHLIDSSSDLHGLPPWLASYIIYNDNKVYSRIDQITSFTEIKTLPANSLRNPVVEKVVNETLLIIRDVWKQYGKPDKIHIELARELKKNNEERKKLTELNSKNEKERERIKKIVQELLNSKTVSNSDVERLRLLEETAGNSQVLPSGNDLTAYKLYADQHFVSPYTGRTIPLYKIFTPEYEIEHIFPKSRFFDNSFTNKTICERAVNKFKDNMTAMEMIKKHGGQKIDGLDYPLLTEEAYIAHISKHFFGKKRRHLLSENIPEGFLLRQLNDTRYISRKLSELLYPIAGKPVITIGSITTELKEHWGLQGVWKKLLLPRFQELESRKAEKLYEIETPTNSIHYAIPAKRIDHRHHALDALIIAATSQAHIQFLNTRSALDPTSANQKKWYLWNYRAKRFSLPWDSFTADARESLSGIIISFKKSTRVLTRGFNLYTKFVNRNGEWIKIKIRQDNKNLYSIRKSLFKQPCGIRHIAECRDVSFKDALKIHFNYISSGTNQLSDRVADKSLARVLSELIKNCEFDLKKTIEFIKKLKDTPEGAWIEKNKKVKILGFTKYSSKRVPLDGSFDESKIDKIPYSSQDKNILVNSLKEHLHKMGSSANAFTGDGLEIFAQKYGTPCRKVTVIEEVGSKIEMKGALYETDKGSNVFYVFKRKEGEEKNSQFMTISAFEAAAKLIKKESLVDVQEGEKLFILTPNDLIIMPKIGQKTDSIDLTDKKEISSQIYRVVSFTKNRLYCLPHTVAEPILRGVEFDKLDKREHTHDGLAFRDFCIPVYQDRLGNLSWGH